MTAKILSTTTRAALLLPVMLACILIDCPDTAAHPHIFIVQRIDIMFDEKGLAGFKVNWTFDDMFSDMIAQDYDKNGNGSLEPKEVSAIKEKAFSYIKKQNYFCFMTIDGKKFNVEYIKDFSAHLEKGDLGYSFTVPCHVSAAAAPKKIKIAVYDPTYYSTIYFADNKPVTLHGQKPFQTKTSIKEDPSTAIYYGMVNPWTLFLEFSLGK